MAAWCAVRRGVGHLAISPEPSLARTAQSLGFQQVGPHFQTEDGQEALPMLLDLGQIRLPLVDLARKQGVFEIFEGIEWACYRAGDPIVLAGEEGQAAYMVVTGEVIVSAERGGPGGRSAFKLATLGAGQLFGELALLTGRRRTASVVAATDADVLVLSRQVFRRELLERPERLVEVLERLACRLADADDLLTR
jgi:signal-transduction protein with cAMP-binding, CBS, and nucleotidyltransferase domain